jgi:hypothetical protein
MSRVSLRELNPTGSLRITGSFGVDGQSTFNQVDPNLPALIVSGAMEIVQAQIQSQIVSASLTIQNLGTLADRSSNANLDLGGFY